MASKHPLVEDQNDDSSSDEDFNPEAQAAEAESSSDSEDEAAKIATSSAPKRGAKRSRDDEVDAELDSGDEATIQERKKRRRRKDKSGLEDFDVSDDEGGEASFIRTRAQRAVEKVERRALASTRGATINVDDVWARLSALPIGRVEETPAATTEKEDDYITIKRTTRFAGQVSTEEKRVLKSSKEARIWLEEQEAEAAKQSKKKKEKTTEDAENVEDAEMHDGKETEKDHGEPKIPLRRPLKRLFRWEPNPTAEVRGLPPSLHLCWPRDKAPPTLPPTAQAQPQPQPAGPSHRRLPPRHLPTGKGAHQLTTVEKSKYDWATYVDKEKLAEELDEYGRSKESYANRTDFLARTEGRKEEARLKAVRAAR